MDYFLNKVDIVKICEIRDPNVVAAWTKYHLINEIGLLRYNVREEIRRLRMDIGLIHPVIDQIVLYIWDHLLTTAQREGFTASISRINNISKAHKDSIDRMNRIGADC